MSRNQLDQETSPYLLQHAGNPVHWRAWGPDALAAAAAADKPILLSIGYAACHWCHVMAHESFEDANTAAQINADFIAIKVDREERPDVDHLYQSALALLGQRGGWPLTMFLTPRGEPFWGGTYFPSRPRFGLLSFRDVLARVTDIFRLERGKILKNAQMLRDGLANQASPESGTPPNDDDLGQHFAAMLRLVDLTDGGVVGAPKFPNVPLFQALWVASHRSGAQSETYRIAVTTTLEHLCQGGIYDHLGGGFSRYSTDEFWMVPHFEKMLYDNAALVELLTAAWQGTQAPLFHQRIDETIRWLEREMRVEDGAFAASVDADSDGEEGKYYVWAESEIDYLLPPTVRTLFKQTYGVTRAGNWEGSNILHRNHPEGRFDPASDALLEQPRRLLLMARRARLSPDRDDKILADWNGMMIAALAKAAFAFDRPDWRQLASSAYHAITSMMNDTQHRLSHHRCQSRNGAAGMLDDYAHMARAALSLYETGGSEGYLQDALRWADVAVDQFWDPIDGAFFQTPIDNTDLMVRSKLTTDQSVPSANGVMVEVLARLSLLTGDLRHHRRAEQTMAACAGALQNGPATMASFLIGWTLLQNPTQLALIGHPGHPNDAELRAVIAATSLPTTVLTLLTPDQARAPLGLAFGKFPPPPQNQSAVYLCRDHRCLPPLTDADSLRRALLEF